jgi:hypothetical protein
MATAHLQRLWLPPPLLCTCSRRACTALLRAAAALAWLRLRAAAGALRR